jgi:hypothetical protein
MLFVVSKCSIPSYEKLKEELLVTDDLKLNTFIGGTASSIYLIVADVGSPSGSGLDFILGQTLNDSSSTQITLIRPGFSRICLRISTRKGA